MILAGIDEAGYGPTLGPLVVSVSVFRIPGDADGSAEGPDLWELLQGAVRRKSRRRDPHRIVIDDSKKLYDRKRGLRGLEEGVLPFLCLDGKPLPRDLRAFLGRVTRRGSPGSAGAADAAAYLDRYPWYRGRNVSLPVDTFANFLVSQAKRLQAAARDAGVEFLGLAACPFAVLEFNREVERERNKARVSFQAVGSFLQRVWRSFPEEAVEVTVDRQGGRARYGPALFEWLQPRGIRIEAQGEDLSAYRLTRRGADDPAPFRVVFRVDSETRSMPVALASMLSKYLREVHMLLFNRFWKELEETLRPTAGYAVDARRFLKDIEPLRQRMKIDDMLLVRKR